MKNFMSAFDILISEAHTMTFNSHVVISSKGGH